MVTKLRSELERNDGVVADLKSKLQRGIDELECSNNIIQTLKEQVQLNSKVEGSSKNFNPELIVRLVNEIKMLKQELKDRKEEAGKNDTSEVRTKFYHYAYWKKDKTWTMNIVCIYFISLHITLISLISLHVIFNVINIWLIFFRQDLMNSNFSFEILTKNSHQLGRCWIQRRRSWAVRKLSSTCWGRGCPREWVKSSGEQTELSTLKTRLTQCEFRLTSSEDQTEQLRSQLALKESKLATTEDLLESLKSSLASKESELSSAWTDLDLLKDQLASLEAELNSKNHQNAFEPGLSSTSADCLLRFSDAGNFSANPDPLTLPTEFHQLDGSQLSGWLAETKPGQPADVTLPNSSQNMSSLGLTPFVETRSANQKAFVQLQGEVNQLKKQLELNRRENLKLDETSLYLNQRPSLDWNASYANDTSMQNDEMRALAYPVSLQFVRKLNQVDKFILFGELF